MDNLTGRIGFIPVYETLPDARDFNEGKIIIDNSQKNPKLKYSKIIDNELVWVTIDGSDSPMIPATMADLDSHLRERDWNIYGRLYSNAEFKKPVINTDFPPSSTTTTTTTSNPEGDNNKTTTELPEINEISQFSLRMRTMSSGLEDEQQDSSDEEIYLSRVLEDLPEIPSVGELSWDSVCLTDGDYDISEDRGFCSIYEELINLKMKKLEQDGNTVDLGTRHYYDIISIRDVERGSSTIDLIALSGSNYTNVINLNSIIEFDTAGTGKFKNCTCNLTVGIEYTVSGKTYVKEHSFIPYFIDAGNLISNSFITNILDYVTLDFHKNCLRVFPMSKKVTECIISYCYIDYEGLF